ncbi:MAG: GNAT family N-acetyltransferase [Rhizobiaceae bacterium]
MNIAPKFHITNENPEDYDVVEKLAEEAFGPGRFTRTAFRLREGISHEPELSFVTWNDDKAIAAVKLTKIWVGDTVALLLGPLVVADEFKSKGYGAELMKKAVDAAREADFNCIILVGDLPYYQRFGFGVIPQGQITLPGPVDPHRLLACPLKEGALHGISGLVRPYG